MKFKIIRDIRDYQILFLSLFLILGIATRDWTLRPEWIALIIVTCPSTQWLLSQLLLVDRWWLVGKINNQQPTTNNQQNINLRSSLITALGLSLLLRADHWTTMVFAAVIAIASKFVFKIGDKHFFNPANFGIISALTDKVTESELTAFSPKDVEGGLYKGRLYRIPMRSDVGMLYYREDLLKSDRFSQRDNRNRYFSTWCDNIPRRRNQTHFSEWTSGIFTQLALCLAPP
ncbi:hypothetical protein [Fischerella thermalis]|uniref:hypothetical protein n=1 Tax=Fischerella thermalis TaxID=372787 RepID=UPI003F6836F8